MARLEDAWERAFGLIEGAAEFGRHEDKGGTIFGWYPSKPGEAVLDGSRIAWLRHTVYDPLDEREVRKLERRLRRSLPDVLRRFYATCANGVDLLGLDVSMYGLRRGRTFDPFDLVDETMDPPPDAGETHLFFGSWGPRKNQLYLDAEDERIHLAGLNSVNPLRTWPDLGDFLVTTLEEQLRGSWDADGRRTGEVHVPDEVAEPIPGPRLELRVPSDLADRAEQVRHLLSEAPDIVAIEDCAVVLAPADELGDIQAGYGIDSDGIDLSGDGAGDWRASWIVIGTDEDLGDPLFVDLADPDLPVFTAMHGAGSWDPRPVAPSLKELLTGA